jgi:hypothetical protein
VLFSVYIFLIVVVSAMPLSVRSVWTQRWATFNMQGVFKEAMAAVEIETNSKGVCNFNSYLFIVLVVCWIFS